MLRAKGRSLMTVGERERVIRAGRGEVIGNGTRNPDIAAPGVSIASYRVPGSTVDQLAPNARYGEDLFLGSGSSQSAAVVSAIPARLLGDYPTLPPAGAMMAELMPTSSPFRSISAPPELPGLIEASV